MSKLQLKDRVFVQRLLGAVRMFLVAALVVVLGEVLYSQTKPSIIQEGISEIATQSLGEPEEVFDLIAEKTKRDSQVELPQGFEDEVISVHDYQEVRANQTAQLVGLSAPYPMERTKQQIEEELRANCWIKVSSNAQPCDSWVKHEGVFCWLWVSYGEVGEMTSVVVHYQAMMEGVL
ncbi:hypothetical protein [Adlercreutzia agrestimuris]|uniref:hypothetical protein n=1 Tax=Adlercreutzia agrestimuris TaxID=2941324 RepID=UPI002041CCC3|nr:hypothetical protein [Adlercreutzia agrestimuris]